MWAQYISSYRHIRPFLVIICAFLSLLVGGFTLFLYQRADRLALARLHEQAAIYHDLINHAKKWNADYGGVYVEKRGGVTTNPYLRKAKINPDLSDSAGHHFTLRNHAIMIAEISRMSEKKGGGKFRLIGLTTLNPANSPNSLEKEALHRFTTGEKEFSKLESGQTPQTYRFIKPLYAEQSCLECHKNRGYSIGNVIGAISITLPTEAILAENRSTKTLLLFWAIATTCMLTASTYFLTWRVLVKLDEVQQNLVCQATTDELTGLMNRRTILKRLDEELQRAVRQQEGLCIMIIDLDHFKRINDTYGHLFGDVVLKSTAACIRDTVRTYDIVGRIGGEEFLVISPGVEIEVAVGLADRVRRQVSELEFEQGAEKIAVTMSVGATSLESSDLSVVSMMKRADRALYQAKDEGRNRVVVL